MLHIIENVPLLIAHILGLPYIVIQELSRVIRFRVSRVNLVVSDDLGHNCLGLGQVDHLDPHSDDCLRGEDTSLPRDDLQRSEQTFNWQLRQVNL